MYLLCKLKLENRCKYSLSFSLSLFKSYPDSGQNQPFCGIPENRKVT